tara:strand:- start:140 stop:550 length:411 start_codon:yes stop_codon:yes gene_type:complete
LWIHNIQVFPLADKLSQVSIFIIGVEKLAQKKFEPDSRFAVHDLDGDGVVSDEELKREERMIRIENADKMADQQRIMCWVSLASVVVSVALVMTPLVPISRIDTISAILSTFYVSNFAIIGSFMATSAWQKVKNGN